jgi:lantibiotic leader peptide-processing serine protease
VKFLKTIPALAGAAVLLSACADDVVQPMQPEVFLSESGSVTESLFSGTGRYLVDVGGRVDRFERQVTALGGTVALLHAPTRIAIVDGLDEQGAAALLATAAATQVVPDALAQLDILEQPVPVQADLANAETPSEAFFFPHQWHLHTIGAPAAWAAGRTGSPEVMVAILDTGIDHMHEDLVGLVDLERSASFVPSDDVLVDHFFPGTPYWIDMHYHGTHVAATVASNASAAAGVTSHTTLIGVKVCNVNGSCPNTSTIAGILHAVDVGAHVINMSLGGATLRAGSEGYMGFLNRVFNYANRSGVTVVVAAGNNASDLDRNYWWVGPANNREYVHFPSLFATYCDVANTLCVSATGPTAVTARDGNNRAVTWANIDAPANYTNFGRSAINVAAPGGRGVAGGGGAVMAACSTFSLHVPVCQQGGFVISISGTSMASPHVAGLAALLAEDYGRNPGRIRAAIQNSADDLGDPGVDPYYGKGRINVPRALGLN